MKRRATNDRLVLRAVPLAACAAGLLLFGLSGCFTNQMVRPQAAEETERERYGVKSLGELCEVGNVEPKPVGGVGLVTGLEGTGGDSPKDENRAALEKYLRQKGCVNVNNILNSGECALVIVSGQIAAGARTGDKFDVEVMLPRGSKATSLRGGYLEECVLYTYDYARGPEGAVSTLKGHPLARAEGVLQLNLGKSEGADDATRLTKGHIWQGGRTKVDNPMSLLLNSDQQFSRVSNLLATRINETFPDGLSGSTKLADPVGKEGVLLRVPPAYKLNIPHYLRVVRLIPMQDNNDLPSGDAGQPKTYRQRLADDLLDPARTVTAALRLEALGPKSVTALKLGLQNKHPLVKFCSAESLMYLGHGAGAAEIAAIVEQQPFLRSYALTALASLDENVTRLKLQELLEKGVAHETRYGAFRALRALDENYPFTRGEELNQSFTLHRVAPGTSPLVHVCTTKRTEIVLFGTEPQLQPPFAFEANGFTVAAQENEDRCIISHIPATGEEPKRRACTLNVTDVLHCLAHMGATYPEVVELLIEAGNCKCLNCPMALNSLPQVPSVQELATAGKSGEGFLELSGQDLGATPTLYERKPTPRSQRFREVEATPKQAETTGATE